MTVTVSEADFLSICSGSMSPQKAFMMGKVKVKGKMPLAMKLGKILEVAGSPRSKL